MDRPTDLRGRGGGGATRDKPKTCVHICTTHDPDIVQGRPGELGAGVSVGTRGDKINLRT